MIRSALARFMYGRNGTDQLGLFMLAVYLVLWLVASLTRWLPLYILEYVLLGVTLYRMLSHDLKRRRAENDRFLQVCRPAIGRIHSFCARAGDREHRYFKCPNCGQRMRVPRGKGRITVHCRSCGASFEEKS